MKVVFSHTTALRILRHYRSVDVPDLPRSRARSLAHCLSSWEDVVSLVPAYVAGERVDVLVGAPADLRKSAYHCAHLVTLDLPEGSLCEIAAGVYIVSPELLFVQMANKLDFIDLVKFGFELCGTYLLDEQSSRGFIGCRPATTVKQLLRYVNRAKGMRGSRTAKRALRWVLDNSNSPVETSLALYLILPIHMGGYGLPSPQLNPLYALEQNAAQLVGQSSMRCDLHWVDANVAIEYDSDAEHITSQALSHDAQRRNALGYSNITVITIRKPMITTPAQFDSIVKMLARALGKRMQPHAYELTPKRLILRSQLFPWLIVSRYG